MILANLTLTIEILKVQLPFDLFLRNQDIYDLITTVCNLDIWWVISKFLNVLKLQIFAKKFSVSLIILLIIIEACF